MAILVAGGAGYIGSHTCVELLERGYEVVVVDNLYNSSEVALERVQEITGKTLKFYKGDILNREDLEPIFENEEIEAVINFAGLKAVGESVEKPWEYYHNNITGTLILCDVMRKHGCKNMIFSSSATVYGDPAEIPITEKCPKGEITNPYGRTKGMLEQILTDLHTGDPVGKLDRLGVFGDDYNTPDGTGVRDYIHVVDLAIGHVKAIERMKKAKGVHIYNLGTGVGYSVLDVVKAYEKACGKEIPYEIKPRRAGDIATCYCDAAKAKEELGWVAERGIEEMCEDSWRWQSANPDGYRS